MTSTRAFVCSRCGWTGPKWEGRCPGCSEWNSLAEEALPGTRGSRPSRLPRAVLLGAVQSRRIPRLHTGMGEVDRVLGGGLVAGSLVLLGGDPGIGKSTLALQLAHGIGVGGAPALYCAGEESPAQLALRAERLGCLDDRVAVVTETSVAGCVAVIEAARPSFAVVDSVQTLHDPEVPGPPGSPSQVRAAVTRLMACAKQSDVAVILIGHVTKEGAIAGPRTLEHMVDVVLYLEGDRHGENRLLRGLKNRFGAASELGLFRLTELGMAEVGAAGRAFVDERSLAVPGNVLTVTSEGSRALVVEVQALTVPAGGPLVRRTAWGLDPNRLYLLVAVLQRRAGLPLGQRDVYVNCVGGVRLAEPGTDLAAAVAICGAESGSGWDPSTAVVGELGLSGEVRRVRRLEARLAEAAAIGVRRAVIPAGQEEHVPAGMDCRPVRDLRETLCLLGPAARHGRGRVAPAGEGDGPLVISEGVATVA
ncbi:MAG TPA: DNA repair protein RadA [Candidatus Binatia bacterium]|nr:DNA repair protein RadA [Candidatus Binatia bacterium]